MDSKLTKPAGSIRTGRLPAIKNKRWNTRFADNYSKYRPEIIYFGNGYTGIIYYCIEADKYIGIISTIKDNGELSFISDMTKDKEKLKEAIERVVKNITTPKDNPQSE